MNILGIDPSPDGKHCCACNGTNLLGVVCTCYTMNFSTPVVKLANDADMLKAFFPDIIIIEKPVPQGERTRLAHYTTLCIEYGKLLAELQQVYPKARIFAVPANVIRAQAGYQTAFGRADPFILHILQMQGYPCGRGKLFNSTHKRDALMCALWNYKDPRNAEYEVKE